MTISHASWDAFSIKNHHSWPKSDWFSVIRVVGEYEALVFTRRQDVAAILRDGETFAAKRSEPPLIPLDLDGDEHLRYRRILAPAFCPAAAKALQPELRRLAAEIFPDAITLEADTYRKHTRPYATAAMLHALGLPESDRDRIGAESFGRSRRSVFADYLRPALPTAGGIAAALRSQLTADELINVVSLCLAAGVENIAVTALLALIDLDQRPEARQQLRDDTGLIPAYVEEAVRCFPFTTMIPRTTTTATNICGIDLPADAAVYAFVGAVNREHGHEPLADGKPHGHFSFGAGIHRCLGMHIARASLTALVEELLTRWPTC